MAHIDVLICRCDVMHSQVSLLMHVALRANVLQCAAVCCSVLQCAAVCYSVLQSAVMCCSVLQCAACAAMRCPARVHVHDVCMYMVS